MSDSPLSLAACCSSETSAPATIVSKGKRRLSQLVALVILGQWSFYGIFRCPFIVPYVSCQNCPIITCHGRLISMFWGFWLLLPMATLLFGRAFCGWACPGGLVSQISGTLAPWRGRNSNAFLRWASYGKFLGLVAALWTFFVLGQPRVDVPIRIGEFLPSVALTFAHAQPLWLTRTIFILAVLALGLVAANLWCRFVCPAGGALELLRLLAIFRYFKTARCNDCDQCRQVCELGTRPDEDNCTNCGDCRSACSRGAIVFGRKGTR